MNNRVLALRVAQLDCEELDTYVTDLIQEQLNKCFHFIQNDFLTNLKPEFQTLAHGFLFYYSLGKHNQTVGQKLLNLRFANKEFIFGNAILWLQICKILSIWFEKRDAVAGHSLKLRKVVTILRPLIKLTELCNFIKFLRKGDYNIFIHRLFGLRMELVDPEARQAELSYTIIGRDILWRGYAEALFYLMTILKLNKLLKIIKKSVFKSPEYSEGNVEDKRICKLCEDYICQAHFSGCGHIFCYYCISVAIAENLKCPTCEQKLTEVFPYKVQN